MRIILLLFLLAANSATSLLFGQDKVIALTGGTIIDVNNFGRSTHDIKNAVVVIKERKIAAVGTIAGLYHVYRKMTKREKPGRV
jgi:hypothetical protein